MSAECVQQLDDDDCQRYSYQAPPTIKEEEGENGIDNDRRGLSRYYDFENDHEIKNDPTITPTGGQRPMPPSPTSSTMSTGRPSQSQKTPNMVVTLQAEVQSYGPCGLALCGGSPTWTAVATLLRWAYVLHFFLWVITFTSLALCSTVSVVYAGWLTWSKYGLAMVVVSALPTVNLMWIMMAFIWHVLCWDALSDYHNFNESLLLLQNRFPTLTWTWIASFLINAPVAVTTITGFAQWTTPAPFWLLQLQFWFSFSACVAMAIVFFIGAGVSQDHDPSRVDTKPPPSRPACLPPVMEPLWKRLIAALMSPLGRAIR